MAQVVARNYRDTDAGAMGCFLLSWSSVDDGRLFVWGASLANRSLQKWVSLAQRGFLAGSRITWQML
jgi:hypothetical protein